MDGGGGQFYGAATTTQYESILNGENKQKGFFIIQVVWFSFHGQSHLDY